MSWGTARLFKAIRGPLLPGSLALLYPLNTPRLRSIVAAQPDA
jgi:hypothetical protein